MPMKQIITVRTPFGNTEIEAETGDNLLDRLSASGVLLRADCGGNGVCGKCLVKIDSGLPGGDADQIPLVGEEKYRAGFRAACQVTVRGNLDLEIPEASLAVFERTDKAALAIDFPVDFKPDSALAGYGLAVDLGTTTIAAYLCERATGRAVGSASVKNPQLIFGEDVMSRISASAKSPEILSKLQQLAVSAVQQASRSLCRSANLAAEDIREMAVVGNPAMMHFFLGIDPAPLGTCPYRPAFAEARKVSASSLGFEWNPSLEIYTAPLVSGFIGSDTVAAALAVGMPKAPSGVMLVDVGTNGELVIAGEKTLMAASCATGPVFEGASIGCGMPATSGAVDSVSIDPRTKRVSWSVLRTAGAPVKPMGLCGSGVISAAAALLRSGMIRSDGRLVEGFAPIRSGQKCAEFVVVPAESSGTGRDIVLTQKDIRAIQLGKGALRAGIELLCRDAGFRIPESIIMSGAFGTFLSPEDVLCIGMLPKLKPSRISAAGNAAGAGAIMLLVHHGTRRVAEQLARDIQTLELAGRPDFEDAFVQAMAFE